MNPPRPDESAPDEVEETPLQWLDRTFAERQADDRYGVAHDIALYVAEHRTPVGFRGGSRP